MPDLNITSTAIEKGLDLVKDFAGKLVGGAIEEVGLMITERVRMRRLNNQITILDKAQKIAEKRNINIKQINLKVLVPLLEFTSLEEEQTLQDMWANLIANYSDSSKVYNSNVFPFILSQLTTEEALFLMSKKDENVFISSIKKKHLGSINLGLDIPEIHNLIRLGLIEKFERPFLASYQTGYRITKIGKEFLECCNTIN